MLECKLMFCCGFLSQRPTVVLLCCAALRFLPYVLQNGSHKLKSRASFNFEDMP